MLGWLPDHALSYQFTAEDWLCGVQNSLNGIEDIVWIR